VNPISHIRPVLTVLTPREPPRAVLPRPPLQPADEPPWLDFLHAVLDASWHRWRHGPRRPAWSWPFEVLVTTLRRMTLHIPDRPLAESRAAWEHSVLSPAVMLGVRRTPRRLNGVPAVLSRPATQAPGLVLLYLHGGAYVLGSPRTHAEIVGRLALATRAPAWAVDYRLAPEHPFPAALEDAVAAYRALRASGVPASDIVVAGDSAGGALCVSLLTALRDDGEALPAGAVLISPWVDLSARGGSLVEHQIFDWSLQGILNGWGAAYLAGADPCDPRASPTFADLRGLPPLLVQGGELEMLVDQVCAFAGKAREAGVSVTLRIWPDMVHDWHLLAPFFAVSRAAIGEAGEFAREVVQARERG
jgi:acetyl esterase/lipase